MFHILSGETRGLPSVVDKNSSSNVKALDILLIESPPQKFQVLDINTTNQAMTIARDDLINTDSDCPGRFDNTTFNQFLFNYSPNVRKLSLFYNCRYELLPGSNNYSCQVRSEERIGFYTTDDELGYFSNLTGTCKAVIKVPVSFTALDRIKHLKNGEWLREALRTGFEVNYQAESALCSACGSSGGICVPSP